MAEPFLLDTQARSVPPQGIFPRGSPAVCSTADRNAKTANRPVRLPPNPVSVFHIIGKAGRASPLCPAPACSFDLFSQLQLIRRSFRLLRRCCLLMPAYLPQQALTLPLLSLSFCEAQKIPQ